MLLSLDERRTVAERFREARAGTLIVHCGAQSTADTVALAAHAAAIGADGVAVIPPPYYPLGDDALVGHFAAAAAACAPTPFYLYAFAARSGYPLPVAVVERVRERADNVAGLKVSEAPVRARRAVPGAGPAGVRRRRAADPRGARGRRGRCRLRARVGVPRGRRRGRAPAPTRPAAPGSSDLRGARRAAPVPERAQACPARARRARSQADVRAPLPPLSPDQAQAVDELAARAMTDPALHNELCKDFLTHARAACMLASQ